MPLMRCEECEHEWFDRARLAVGGSCPECGCEETRELGSVGDFEEAEFEASRGSDPEQAGDGPRIAFARRAAVALLREHSITKAPVPVDALARLCGLTIEDDVALEPLRGRLVDTVIQLAHHDSPRARRFALAHELGHHRMKTGHGSGPGAEPEANAFAGELLVPGHMLHRELQRTTDATQLCARFEVTRQVLEIAATAHRVRDKLL